MKFALVFDSPSEQGGYIQNSLDLLQQVGEVSTITSNDILKGTLSSYHAVVFPGGLASFKGLNRYGTDFGNAIRFFVAAGGGYLGICGGAYIAGREPADVFHLFVNLTLGLANIKVDPPPVVESIQDYINVQWQGKQAPLPTYPVDFTFASIDHPIIDGHSEETATIAYSSGPAMSEPGTTVDVLAYFATEGYTRKIALIATYFGQGRVVLCSPHPEALFVGGIGLPWLYTNMATWVAEREITVAYPVIPWGRPFLAGVPFGWAGIGLFTGIVGGAIISRIIRKQKRLSPRQNMN